MFVKVAKCPTTELARTNFFILNPDDFARIGSPPCVVVSRQGRPFIINLRPDSLIAPSYIGTSLFHRRWASLSLNEEIQLEPLREAPLAAFEIVLEAEFAKKNDVAPAAFDGESMAAIFKDLVKGQILTIESQLLFEFQGYQLLLTVKNIEGVEERAFQQAEPPRGSMRPVESAKVVPHTDTVFYKARNSIIKIRGDPAKAALNPIIQPNFKFEDLGIGGLKNEFSDIFRRAFASRIFPPSIVERMGIQHIKGILLFGPPGTGKTLMARQIGKMLNAREPVIINGPEVLNKYVGASEENIRKLFAPAEQEYKEKGDDSQLHIIIFDELDAICRQRGSKSDSTGVGDSIVNQLLAKLDGVDQLNNILLIGMTNRKDMIDEALLRPGRLEVHMEIGLPDEGGRIEIINIHTSKMRANNLLGQDVDPVELASRTKNFSGAEIFGLVKSASSFAFTRHVQVGQVGVSADAKDIQVLRDDFMHALEEVRAAFGASEAELHQCIANGIIKVRATESILEDGGLLIKQVASSDRTPLVSALLYGPAGSGKTALAAMIAISSKYPFIKLISPENMIGMSESQKINEMHKVFNNASKSDLSVIMIDDIERILDWVPIGPRFSNNVLQALLVLLKKQPPSGKRLLVICTATQKHVLDSLDLTSAFDSLIYTPPIQSLDEIGYVLDKLSLFETDSLRRRTMEYLGAAQGSSGRFQITMKRLIMCAEMARQDEEKKAEKLVELLSEVALVQNDRVRLDDL